MKAIVGDNAIEITDEGLRQSEAFAEQLIQEAIANHDTERRLAASLLLLVVIAVRQGRGASN